MRKKFGILFLCMILVSLAISGTALAADEQPTKIYIDNKLVGKEGDALLVDNSTVYVPLRDICEYYNAEILWDENTNKVTVNLDGIVIETYLWSHIVQANGRVLYDEYESVLYNDEIFMLPARVLAKALNARVLWNDENNSVHFYSALEPIESGDSFYDADELYWLSRIIYCEAGNQLLEGKIAVGNVVLNRVADASFPDSIYDVIFQRGQFCPAGNGAIYCTPNEESVLAAKLALEGVNTVGNALFFQNTAITGRNWMSNTRQVIAELGNHTFYA